MGILMQGFFDAYETHKQNHAPVTNASEFKQAMLQEGIAQTQDLKGCSDEELAALERKYGVLNADYKALLRVMGHRAGYLVDSHEVWLYYDQLDAINSNLDKALKEIEELCLEDGEPFDIDMPEHYMVISARYGDDEQCLMKTNSSDPKVYFWNDEGEVVPAFDNVWDWILSHLITAEMMLDKGTYLKNHPERQSHYRMG